MTNYNELSATANTVPYRRVHYIGISNPPMGWPTVELLEADSIILNGVKQHLPEIVGGINTTVDAAALAEEFPLLNPSDDTPLGGTVSGGQLFAFLYSWARHQQGKRDALVV